MTNLLLLMAYVLSVVNLIPLGAAIFLRKKSLVYVLAALELVLAVIIALMANRVPF